MKLVRRLPFNEIIIICLFLFILNNFTGKSDEIILADGIGYYEYLPSIFIHKDFVRLDKKVDLSRVEPDFNYTDYKEGKKINKYPCGTAILQSPFFIINYLINKENVKTGYEESFQKAIFISTVFYLFLGLLFIRKLLLLYQIKISIIFILQFFLTLGTNIFFYTHYNGSFSHIYSFFLITLFLYLIKKLSLNYTPKAFYLSIIYLGLIVLVRQINILIILIIPFIYGSWSNLKLNFVTIIQTKRLLIIGGLLFISILFIQSITWYLQVGALFVYSYQGETFNFTNPKIFNILFSYKKGLFIYTPFIFFAILATSFYIFKKRYYELCTFLLFFIFLTYILSSWWSWYYGCSFGLRAYIDFYTVLIIPFALALNQLSTKFITIASTILFPLIPINLIQTYQYKEYIIHWIDMNKERYWTTFLRTEDQFKGLLWSNSPKENELTKFKEKNYTISPKNYKFNYRFSSNFKKCQHPILKVELNGFFDAKKISKVKLYFLDNQQNIIHYDERYTLTFSNEKINQEGKGYFFYTLDVLTIQNTSTLQIEIEGISNEFNKLTIKEFSNR